MQIYHVSDRGAYERSRSGIYEMATASIVLTIGSIYSPRKALEIFPGACPDTDRRFDVCNMHFGFKKFKK